MRLRFVQAHTHRPSFAVGGSATGYQLTCFVASFAMFVLRSSGQGAATYRAILRLAHRFGPPCTAVFVCRRNLHAYCLDSELAILARLWIPLRLRAQPFVLGKFSGRDNWVSPHLRRPLPLAENAYPFGHVAQCGRYPLRVTPGCSGLIVALTISPLGVTTGSFPPTV
jgi:hypothetical protein